MQIGIINDFGQTLNIFYKLVSLLYLRLRSVVLFPNDYSLHTMKKQRRSMMLTQLNFTAPHIELKNLNNLWLQLSNYTCNLKCKHCYLSCYPSNKSDFLALDKIKNALEEAKIQGVKEIYLNGGEPLLHHDINTIIRLALKITNVTILTNGTLLNDKKARFLKQIEQNHDFELIFRVSLDHYSEVKNDEIRGKGSFKKTISGINNLIRYGFNPIISAVNIWNEDESNLKSGFFELLSGLNFEPDDMNVKIIPAFKIGEFAKNFEKYEENELVTNEIVHTEEIHKCDCANSRVVTDNGIYSCPILVNDPRGKLGKTLVDSSKKVFLETSACYTCQNNKKPILNNNWTN